LELNSTLAVASNITPDSVAFMKKLYPTIDFQFGPDLIAFPLEGVSSLAVELLAAMKQKDLDALKPILFDSNLATFLAKDNGTVFLKLLGGLDKAREELQWALRTVPFGTNWPQEISYAMNLLVTTEGAH
jgi:hypothetical protein